ncbi:MAG: glycosyltransferase [Hamadaea sp.]|nr:glycosyltransferase [Hamadaea sp.]NUR50242.1 glycosyltransferase [Hamadaea sp.]
MFNVEPYLAECIESILSYTDDDIELVAVDDRSPDGSPALLDAYAAADDRVNVLHLPVNVGLGQARNAGLDAATGDYIWFVDSDDWLPAGALDQVMERLRATEPDVLLVSHAEVFEDSAKVDPLLTRVLTQNEGPLTLQRHPELLRLAQSACTKIVRRDLLVTAGIRFLPGWYEDSYFSHLLLMAADRLEAIDRVSYCYRQRTPGSITSSRSDRHFEVFDQYARLFSRVDLAHGTYDKYRPELFRLMINHYLVVLGNRDRLPSKLRSSFFHRIATDYAARVPPSGYPVPSGALGVKHRLVRWGFYPAYAVLRAVYGLVSQVRSRRRPDGVRLSAAGLVPDRRPRSVVLASRCEVMPPRQRSETPMRSTAFDGRTRPARSGADL